MKLYRIPNSTNVDRVALALAHKQLPVESVVIDPADRTEIIKMTGQRLVPVIQDGDRIIFNSMTIVRYLEDNYPKTAKLYPRDRAREAEVTFFVDWFEQVWKPTAMIIRAQDKKPLAERDPTVSQQAGEQLQGYLGLFEALLQGRDYLFGEFGAADCSIFPFVRYASLEENEIDDHPYHRAIQRYQRLKVGDGHPNLTAWIQRMNQKPMV